MYDFTCPIVDSVGGVTHVLRATEYIDRDQQYYLTLGAFCFRYHPVLIHVQCRHAECVCKSHIWFYARLSMARTVMSERKLAELANEGVVSGL